jgi:two-component system sensor histidine kinase KdpD
MPSVDNVRPTPEELLRKVQDDERRENRGRLKVFLGYASRVGKSFRMFDEGRRRKDRGQDVVIGALQPDMTPDMQEIVHRLEVIPTLPATHAGRDYRVMDIPGLFRRHPMVCLVDGLAYDNPPGSRNPHRYQDVSELLDRGIAVITAVNLQHIREQQDRVERITGKRAANSVPEEFLLDADEIEVVDASPDALIGRASSGSGAMDARRLAELREMALLLAADVVDRQLQAYLDSHGVAARWGAQERILVCLTPRSNAADMLRSGHRNRLRFHGAMLAAYVEQTDLRPQDREMLEKNLAMAREVGAEIHPLRGTDFVDTILAFAREQRITQLFLGHTGRPGRAWFARSPIERMLDGAEGFDVRLFPHEDHS